uniref:Choline transporter-like protein n=1 Tax=Sinocyclocheilus anshuiensis TaxID=1608454 RepID=A0A671QYN3_9TELE
MTRPKGGYYKAELGEPHKFDPTFRGPVHHRGCTDVLCCVIFVIVILGYIVLGTVAWMHGDPRKVVYPTDSYGQFCGQQGTPNANKAILFYFNILQCANPTVLINLQCPTTQLCVSKCPDRFATYIDMQYNYRRNKSYWEYYKQFCKPGFNYPDKPVSQVLRDEDCPSMIVPSRPFLQRCFPDFITRNGTLTVANQTSFKDGHGKIRSVNIMANGSEEDEVGIKIFEDYASSWFWILIGLVISMLVSLIFILLLRFTAGILFWMVIFGVIAAVGYGIWHCYWEYSSLKGKPDSDITISDIGFQTDFRVYLQLRQTWLIFMISLAVIEAIIILVLIFLRNRVRIAIALLKEGSKAIGCIMSTLFYPIITFLLLAICIAYWAVTAVFLASSGDAVYKVMSTLPNCKYTNLTCDPETFSQSNVTKLCPGSQCTFAFYGGESLYHRYIFVLQLCNLLVFLWLVNFTIALGQCTLAGAFASYYWALRKPADIPPCPLASSFGRALRYHTGSLAFGALILSIVQFVCWNTVIFGSYMIAHGFFNVYAMCVDTLFLCFLLDLEKNDGSVFRPYYMGSSLRAILNKKNHKRPEEKKKGRQQKK